jgi:hypothetical protein
MPAWRSGPTRQGSSKAVGWDLLCKDERAREIGDTHNTTLKKCVKEDPASP